VVGEASDGIEAVEKVESLQPDVVVLDVTMPRMNGLEACRFNSAEAQELRAGSLVRPLSMTLRR